jgi:hypothetical protein
MYRKRDSVLDTDFRISFATCAFTVRSSIPRGTAISLFDRPATSISSTSRSRFVKSARPNSFRLALLERSTNIARILREAQINPLSTTRIALTNSAGGAASSTYPLTPFAKALRTASSLLPDAVTITRRLVGPSSSAASLARGSGFGACQVLPRRWQALRRFQLATPK